MHTITTFVIYFFVYSFIGWIAEVCYAFYVHRRFINRGFLTGPLCPLYGLGIGLIIALLSPLENNAFIFFVSATVLISALEFLAGWLLEVIFKAQWWDYSSYRFNLRGYICLQFSLIFGLGATLFYYLVHPFIAGIIAGIPQYIAYWLAGASTLIFMSDLVSTVVSALHLKLRMVEMQAILKNLAAELAEDFQNSNFISERREDILNIKRDMLERYEWLRAKSTVLQRRLLSSFPEARPRRFTAAFEDIRKSLSKR